MNAERVFNELDSADKEGGPLEFRAGRFEILCVIEAVQMALRQPGYTGPRRDLAEKFIRHVQGMYPEMARALIEKGFNPEHDTIVVKS